MKKIALQLLILNAATRKLKYETHSNKARKEINVSLH